MSKKITIKTAKIERSFTDSRSFFELCSATDYSEMFDFFAHYPKAMKASKVNARESRVECSKFNKALLTTKSAMFDKSLECAKSLADHALACNVKTSVIRRHIAYLESHRASFCRKVIENSLIHFELI